MKLRHLLLKPFQSRTSRKTTRLVTAGLLILFGWAGGSLFNSPTAFELLMITATLIAGYDIAQRAWNGLRNRQTTIELLVTIAATGGLAIGIFWESAAVTFLFQLGGWLEARSLRKTRQTLKQLIDLAPESATILENGNQKEIPAHQVRESMLVLVKPGGKVPVDGLVEEGVSAVDESSITGEPVPSLKQEGSDVFAGTLNQNGRLVIRASRVGAETTLSRIIQRIEEAQESKAPTQRFIERFATWYTPAIVALGVVALVITGDLELALTLLVIGCPGALVISTPISIISGIGRAAKSGILIKGGEYLESAGSISALALDKTGTLTEGKPKITDILISEPALTAAGRGVNHVTFDGSDLTTEVEELLTMAGIAESVSEHPLARAILSEAREIADIPEPDQFEAHTGKGVEAEHGSDHILAGSPEFIEASGIPVSQEFQKRMDSLRESGRTMVLVARNGTLLGAIGLSDKIRPEAVQMVRQLREMGLKRILMLTGDNRATAETIAREAGIDEVHAHMLPEEKLEMVQQLKSEGHRVAMIGDGINDAPALATADIGIAMGAAGTDIAIETADVALMADDLLKVPEALRVSKLTVRNIRQNVAFALVTVTLLLAGVIAGSVHMAGGMLVHELSVMAVILNGMRLRYIRPSRSGQRPRPLSSPKAEGATSRTLKKAA